MSYREKLIDRANYYKNTLNKHQILEKYWNQISLIMKGSTARGYSDKYSDIDFVIFTDEQSKNKIVSEYIAAGLSQRKDGIFLPLGDWEGHYNIESYEKLKMYFTTQNMPNIWEYTNVIIMHDNNEIYSQIIQERTKNIFKNIDDIIKQKYIDIQLYLDWLRQPLRRADRGASLLYSAHILQYSCQLMFLLLQQPYPCDKWLFYYLEKLDFSHELKIKLTNYYKAFSEIQTLIAEKELSEYILYSYANDIVLDINQILYARYGKKQWIDEWYLYA